MQQGNEDRRPRTEEELLGPRASFLMSRCHEPFSRSRSACGLALRWRRPAVRCSRTVPPRPPSHSSPKGMRISRAASSWRRWRSRRSTRASPTISRERRRRIASFAVSRAWSRRSRCRARSSSAADSMRWEDSPTTNAWPTSGCTARRRSSSASWRLRRSRSAQADSDRTSTATSLTASVSCEGSGRSSTDRSHQAIHSLDSPRPRP